MSAYIPPLKVIPPGATREMRRQMHNEYLGLLRASNPGKFNADGTLKTGWQIFKSIFLPATTAGRAGD